MSEDHSLNSSVYHSALNPEFTSNVQLGLQPELEIPKCSMWESLDLMHTPLTVPEEKPLSPPTLSPEFSSEELPIKIETPTLVSQGFWGCKSYYLYTIKSQKSTVKRRYRDFEWLETLLRQKYQGLGVPLLPPKQLIKWIDKAFLEERRAEMQKFLEILTKHPQLKNSPELNFFLTCPDQTFKDQKQNMEEPTQTFQFENYEDAYDQILSKVQSRLENCLEVKILPSTKNIVKIDKTLDFLSYPVENLVESFANWTVAQNKTMLAFSELCVSDSKLCNSLLQEFKHLYNFFKKRLSSLNIEVKEELIKLQGMKQSITSYKHKISKFAEVETLLHRKQSKAQNSLELNSAKLTKEDLNSIQTQISQIEEKISSDYKWYNQDRTSHLKNTLKSIVSFQTEACEKEEKFWLEKKHCNYTKYS